MKEHPILFSGEMVRAILSLKKTQTRRIIKFPIYKPVRYRPGITRIFIEDDLPGHKIPILTSCPYGHIGDHLWVRETFVLESDLGWDIKLPTDRPIKTITDDYDNGEYHLIPHYRATEPEPNIVPEGQDSFDDRTRWTPSIFMPHWASRITLVITGIRVERLQEISEADAKAEGVKQVAINLSDNTDATPYKEYYRQLWDSINGKKHPWESNPWVWVIEFEVWDDKSAVIPEGAKVI